MSAMTDAGLGPSFDFEAAHDADVVRVRGEIDLDSSPQLDALIDRTLPSKLLIVDLSHCTYIDSTTLTVFVRAHKRRGAHLRLVVPPDAHIRRLFELTKLDEILSVVPSRDAAFR